ncbi:hypothetical protein DUNSADRAFT_18743 [Dunaliella salina]|uniref:Encoded protein n=1 Tax=Dunaliella salina TaxID=3046 RepID=A0ABQ7GYQ3_DUNSA|nr:hypothetical protein DUNSADRAFT_18743 [Dunaliella salina]|eukprot:KAF5839741.1 hypothetical protein DUNSADRAFT_18743 [Dunaliella salina]
MQGAVCSPATQLFRLSLYSSFRMLPHAVAHQMHGLPAFPSGGLLTPQPHAQRPATILAPCSPQGHTMSGLLNSIQCSRSSRRRRDPLHQLCPPMLSSFATSAAKEVADASPQGPGVTATAPPKPSSPLALVQQAGIQIPQYCCGCGVKLQQVDPEGSGYFIVPSRLVEMAEETLQGSSRDHEPDDDDDMLLGSSAEDPLQAEYEEALQGLASKRRARGARGAAVAEDEAFPVLGEEEEPPVPDILCQRCFSLKHSGCV